jgi:oxidoreductase
MNVLLMGGGWIAETVYVPFLSELAAVTEIYVCDLDPQVVAERFAAWPKVSPIAADEARRRHFDAACVLTPNHRHAADLEALLDRVGKVLVEKPICISSAEADRLATHIAASETTVWVSAPLRYRPDLATLRDEIIRTRLGEIYAAEITWFKRKGTPGSAWFTDRAQAGGGVLMDMGPHLIDLSYWLFGRATPRACLGSTSALFFRGDDVYADWHAGAPPRRQPGDVEDSAFGFMAYPSRSLGLKLAWVSQVEKDDAGLLVMGTRGCLHVNTAFGFSTQTLHPATQVILSTAQGVERRTLEIGDRRAPFRPMLRDFIESTQCDLPSGDDALRVMHDIAGLYASAGTTS